MSRISVLSNGVKVATYNNGAKFGVQAGLFSGTGSGNEALGYQGKMNLLANAVTIANPGIKATTTRANTNFKTVNATAAGAISSLASAVSNTDFAKNIDAARAMSHKQAHDLDFDYARLAMEYAYKTGFQGQSLGEPVTGTTEVINSCNADELKGAAERIAHDGLVVAVVGDVNHDEVANLAEKTWGGLSQGYLGGRQVGQLFTGSWIKHRFDSLCAGYLAFMQHTAADGPAAFNLAVIGKMIGTYDSTMENCHNSPCNLRRRFGYRPDLNVHDFGTFYNTHCGSGVFGFTLNIKSDACVEAGEVVTRIQDYIANLRRSATSHEVARAKNQVLQEAASAIQADPLEFIGGQVLEKGVVMDVTAWKNTLAGVSEGTVKDTASTWLYDTEYAAGMVGAVEAFMADYSMRARTASQRAFAP